MTAESRDKESQFENPQVSKLEDETNEDGSPRNQVDRLAEKLAKKSTTVEQDSGENRSIFTK
jgi:Ran GTPase-activating protein (RanGAP) involved in mRNA processing and transport